MPLTPLAVATLALLAERPMHPYEMFQLLQDRHEDELVKVRPGSLYHAVDRLHAAELVTATGTEREGNRPERTTYAITPDGSAALTSRIREMLSTPVNEYPQFPVALAEAHNLPADTAVEDLGRYAAALAEQIRLLDLFLGEAVERGVDEAYWIEGDYLRTVRRAEHAWITNLITRIENKDLTWQPHHPA